MSKFDWEKATFDVEYFTKAHVERYDENSPNIKRANMAIGDIGNFIKHDCLVNQLRELEYVGSAAIHIYIAPVTRQAIFISQPEPLKNCPEEIAAKAAMHINQEMKAYYGHKQKKTTRSGA